MEQGMGWIRRLAERTDGWTDAVPGLPVVEIAGDRRILIENHRGVTQYGRDNICVNVAFGQLMISGSCLELIKMTKGQLVICGRIDQLTLSRRKPL